MTKPIHPVELLVAAIAMQEGGADPKSLPALRHNPCDLRYAGQTNATRPDGTTTFHRPLAQTEPIAVFLDEKAGIVAGYRDIWAKVANHYTVRQIISIFAPPNENNTAKYLENVLKWTGLPPDVPVINLIPTLPNLTETSHEA